MMCPIEEKYVLHEAGHARHRYSESRRYDLMAPGPAPSGGTALLRSIGFSAIDYRPLYRPPATMQFRLMSARHYSRLADWPLYPENVFQSMRVRSSETLEGIRVPNLTIALWVLSHGHY